MRVNIYAEEMTDRVELFTKTVEGEEFTAVRFYLELPVTAKTAMYTGFGTKPTPAPADTDESIQVQGPFMHRPDDDDSSAVTFWGKRQLRGMLTKALQLLDRHEGAGEQRKEQPEQIPVTQLGEITIGQYATYCDTGVWSMKDGFLAAPGDITVEQLKDMLHVSGGVVYLRKDGLFGWIQSEFEI